MIKMPGWGRHDIYQNRLGQGGFDQLKMSLRTAGRDAGDAPVSGLFGSQDKTRGPERFSLRTHGVRHSRQRWEFIAVAPGRAIDSL